MYQPPHFQEEHLELVHDLIRAHPFATLVAHGTEGLTADHIPLVIHPELSDKGILRGHIAKANPLWKNYSAGVDVLTIFQGSHHYVSPSWYPSKQEHGKVVPTWNYAVVHAYGALEFIQDKTWLRAHLDEMTTRHETGREAPWAVSDAPDDFIEKQLKGIVGIEISISRFEGKLKLSQNKSEEDRLGVRRGIAEENSDVAVDTSHWIDKLG